VELTADLEDAPTSTTVRGLLRILERKGQIVHDQEGLRYVYRPAIPKREAGASTLAHVVRTFFEGSPSRAMAALLGSQESLSEQEIAAIEKVIRQARGGKS
jgi:predicted transcriptional regulator